MATESNEYEQENKALATREPRSGQVARQDFSGSQIATQSAATEALVAKARADVEARWIIAQRNRRSLDDVRQDLIAECKRPSFARVAMYSIPRGGKQIEGLSIRFAEAAARCMGNLQPEVQTIYDSPTARIVKVTVTDYETNVTWSRDLNITKTVEKKQIKRGQRPLGERENSYGDRVFIVEATDDEVNVKEAAMVSKTARTLILRVIPGHIQDECKALIRQVAAQADAKDPNAAKTRALDAFALLGIKPSQLVEYLGKPLEQATREDWTGLSQIHNAIRDGETTWLEVLSDALETPREPAQAKPTTAPPQAPAQPANVAPVATGEAVKPAEPAKTEPPKKPSKGAAALKADLAKAGTAGSQTVPVVDPREAEPEWMVGATRGARPAEPESSTAKPDSGLIEVTCSGCDSLMDIAKDQPKPWLCYACRQA